MAPSPRTISDTEFADRTRPDWIYRWSVYGLVISIMLMIDWYTIHAVDQDTFEDVPMPPAPALPTAYPGVKHKNLDDSLEGVRKKV
jgi:hypothetical protein